MQSLEDCSVFFESEPVDADLSCSAFDAQALDEAEVDFGQSFGDVSGSTTKEAELVVKTALSLLGC